MTHCIASDETPRSKRPRCNIDWQLLYDYLIQCNQPEWQFQSKKSNSSMTAIVPCI